MTSLWSKRRSNCQCKVLKYLQTSIAIQKISWEPNTIIQGFLKRISAVLNNNYSWMASRALMYYVRVPYQQRPILNSPRNRMIGYRLPNQVHSWKLSMVTKLWDITAKRRLFMGLIVMMFVKDLWPYWRLMALKMSRELRKFIQNSSSKRS